MSMSEVRALVAEWRASKQARATPIMAVAEIIDGSPRMSIPDTIERSGSEDPPVENEDQLGEDDDLRYIDPNYDYERENTEPISRWKRKSWIELSQQEKDDRLTMWKSWGGHKITKVYDPIRDSFIADITEQSSGCEIWWPM